MQGFLKMVLLLWAPAQMEDEKSFERGLIIMGALPGRKGKILERDNMIGLDGETRAEERTRKEVVGLEKHTT